MSSKSNRNVSERAIFQLNALQRLTRAKLEDAAEAGAEVLLNEAKLRAPARTGKLRDSLDKRFYEKNKDSATYLVYSSAFYADAVEKSVKGNARPFMRPAFDAKQGEIADVMRARLVKIFQDRTYRKGTGI